MNSKNQGWKNIPSIGKRFEYIREQTGKNQTDFAKYLDVSPSAISTVERNESEPGPKIVKGLLSKLPQISIEWLYTGEGNYKKGEEYYKEVEKQL